MARISIAGACTSLCMVLLMANAAHAVSAANKCEASELKTSGKYCACRLKADAKAVKTGGMPDFSKCDSTFSTKFGNADTQGMGQCPSSATQAQIQTFVTQCTDGMAAALAGGSPPVCLPGLPKTGQTQCDQGAGTLGACPGSPAGQDGAVRAGAARSYTDNGDGTITDNVTGLMWERQSADGSIHSIVNIYTWYDAFNVKIAALNSGGGFAGHTDWRLPNLTELQSLADYGRESPAIDPVFNTSCSPGCALTACSCTFNGFHWSSTTRLGNPISPQAWLVSFIEGAVSVLDKSPDTFVVRAVRGGL